MSKLKKALLMCTAYVLVAVIAIGGTVAYLTSEDSDVNVMTLGNVKIEQHEYERVVDAEGNFVIVDTSKVESNYGYNQAYKLQEFTQEKPAYPAVYTNEKHDVAWDEFQQLWNQVGAPGSNDLFDDSVKNVIDKFVFVENTGKSDAYYRTIIAIEAPEDLSEGTIHTSFNSNSRFDYNNEVDGVQNAADANKFYTEIDGVRYLVYVATYTQILKPEEVSRPSFLQAFLDPKTTNEDCALFGDTWEIIVVSQAVQADGFDNAITALEQAFGNPSDVDAVSGAMLCDDWLGDAINDYEASKISKWDGTYNTEWYNETDTEFTLTSANELAGLGVLVDGGNNFAGKTIKLGNDMDFELKDENGEKISLDPIGDDAPFAGTFDGQDHTIFNIYQSGWAFGYEWGKYGTIGLFGELENATVKNVTISGSEGEIEGGDIGGITGSATGTCVFEDITIENSKLGTYNNGIGGIIGWSGAGNYTFKNIEIKSDVVLGGLWGSFDSSIGGVVGQGEPGATYNFENVDIACRLDAYNDVTASYDYYNYRMCGMIIGRLAETTTIDGVNYPDMSKYNITCKDVTVTYDDWANYHYCRAEGARGKRVEAGYAYGGIAADYDHSVCTVHHMELIAFDQIFGGDQYGVKGLKAYDGVTVIYNQ